MPSHVSVQEGGGGGRVEVCWWGEGGMCDGEGGEGEWVCNDQRR